MIRLSVIDSHSEVVNERNDQYKQPITYMNLVETPGVRKGCRLLGVEGIQRAVAVFHLNRRFCQSTRLLFRQSGQIHKYVKCNLPVMIKSSISIVLADLKLSRIDFSSRAEISEVE